MRTIGLIINNYPTPYREDLFSQVVIAGEDLGKPKFLYAMRPEAKRLAIGWGSGYNKWNNAKNFYYANDPSFSLSGSGSRLCLPLRSAGAMLRSPAKVFVCTLSRDMALVQLACWLVARAKQKKLVYWVGDVPDNARLGLAHRAIDQLRCFLLRRADGYIFYSKKSLIWTKSQGANPDKAAYWIGGQVRHFRPGALFERRKGRPTLRLLMVGGDDPRKGLSRLLQDCDEIAARFNKQIHVIVVGGPKRYRKHVGRLLVTSLGRVAAQDMHSVYSLCDATIISSSREPWGFAFNEAILAQRPCIVADRAGSATVAEGYGLSYTPGHSSSLLEALRKTETISFEEFSAIKDALRVDRAASQFLTFLGHIAAGRTAQIDGY